MPSTSRTGVRRVAAVVGWAAAAALAGWIAWWAVALIAGQAGTNSTGVLTQAQVEALAAEQATAPPGTPSPEPSTPAPDPTITGPSPSTTAPGPDVARTWTVPGGQVAAACRDTTITLLFATPDDGWTVEINDTGPQNLEVEFRHGEDETNTSATCQSGIPNLVEESSDD